MRSLSLLAPNLVTRLLTATTSSKETLPWPAPALVTPMLSDFGGRPGPRFPFFVPFFRIIDLYEEIIAVGISAPEAVLMWSKIAFGFGFGAERRDGVPHQCHFVRAFTALRFRHCRPRK